MTAPLCSNGHCPTPAVGAVQVSMPHGMGHALYCAEHGPRPGDRDGVVGLDTYLTWTNTAPANGSYQPPTEGQR